MEEDKILPQLIIFGLKTLFPFYISEIQFPLTKLNDGKVIDSNDRVLSYYPEVPQVLEKVNKLGILSAIRFDFTGVYQNSREILQLFELNSTITYEKCDNVKFSRNETKKCTEIFLRYRRDTRINFDKMIVFESNPTHLQCAKNLKIFSVFIHSRRGITMKILNSTLETYHLKNRKKSKSMIKKSVKENAEDNAKKDNVKMDTVKGNNVKETDYVKEADILTKTLEHFRKYITRIF